MLLTWVRILALEQGPLSDGNCASKILCSSGHKGYKTIQASSYKKKAKHFHLGLEPSCLTLTKQNKLTKQKLLQQRASGLF